MKRFITHILRTLTRGLLFLFLFNLQLNSCIKLHSSDVGSTYNAAKDVGSAKEEKPLNSSSSNRKTISKREQKEQLYEAYNLLHSLAQVNCSYKKFSYKLMFQLLISVKFLSYYANIDFSY
jgi:hypothetical protein